MANGTEKPALIKIADLFHSHGVDYIVIGGQAAVLYGSTIPTFDVDLEIRPFFPSSKPSSGYASGELLPSG